MFTGIRGEGRLLWAQQQLPGRACAGRIPPPVPPVSVETARLHSSHFHKLQKLLITLELLLWELSLQGYQAGVRARVCGLPWIPAGAQAGGGWEWEALPEHLPGSAARPRGPSLALIPGVGNCSHGSASRAASWEYWGVWGLSWISVCLQSWGWLCQHQVLLSTIPSLKEKQQNSSPLPISLIVWPGYSQKSII